MSIASIRQQTADRMASGDGRACLVCGTAADGITLSMFGARCFPCYQAYRREPLVPPPRSKAAERIRAEIAAMGKGLPP